MASHEHDAAMDVADPEVKKPKSEHESAHGHSHEHADGEEAAKITALGTVTVGGATFAIDREGQVESGKTTEFGVELVGAAAAKPHSAWLANPDGTKVCEPVSAEEHLSHWHFNVEPLMPVKKSKFVLKVGDEEAIVDWCRGADPCNDGILSVFKAVDAPAGGAPMFLELKLHGDAGDLELFLYERFPISDWKTKGKPAPFDIPKDSVVTLTFPSHENKSVELRVRNDKENEDEDGKPNMRGNGTNYFIFPGESGQDPEWLKGEKARYNVTVTFQANGKSYAADPFVLVPHEAL